MLKSLLQAGAAVNRVDLVGRTPLHRHLGAPHRGKAIIDLLLSGGADVNAVDKRGRTVLDEATRRNPRDPIGDLLRRQGAVG